MKLTDTSWNKQFSQEEQKVCHLVQDSHPTEETEKSQSGREMEKAMSETDSREIYESAHTIK